MKEASIFKQANNIDDHFRASVLDRLVDIDIIPAFKPVQNIFIHIDQYKLNILRDLEKFLNTRRKKLNFDNLYYKEIIGKSLLNYGLENYTNKNPNNISFQNELSNQIVDQIATYEPRLKKIEINIDTFEKTSGMIHFVIDAILEVPETKTHVNFKTSININNGFFNITDIK